MFKLPTKLFEESTTPDPREVKVAKFVEMIKATNVSEWDLDLIWSVYDSMLSSCESVRLSLAGVYQMGVIAERERREGGKA